MRSSLPSLDDYLDSLPAGIDSYPEATVKGSVFRSFSHPALDELKNDARIPEPVLRLLRDMPTPTTWLPEVYWNVIAAALYDVAFRDEGGFAAYEAWRTEQNFQLLNSVLYRILFAVVGPERFWKAASDRWAIFHRGSVLKPVDFGPKFADVELTFPANLYPPCSIYGFSSAYRAALRAANVRVTSLTWKPVSTSLVRWHVEWQ